jgi:hypothetical protein
MMQQNNEQLKIIAELKKNFDDLLQLNNQAISQIPSEMMPDQTKILNDIGKIQKMVNKMDRNGLNKLFKKYSQNAGKDSK